MRIEFKADAAQVQAVGIVASIYGCIARRTFLCMELAGMVEFFKLFLRNVEELFLEALLGKFRPALAMFAVVAVIFALAVVKERKQAHYLVGAEIFGFETLPAFFIVCTIAYACNGGKSIYAQKKLRLR